VLAVVRELVDRDREAAEQRLAAIREADRDRAGAVERRPDELGADFGRLPGRREAAVSERAGEDAKAVARLSIRPAHEAARERVLLEARIAGRGGPGLVPRRRCGQVELDGARRCFRDEALAVDYAQDVRVAFDREGSLERRRRAQSHLRIAGKERSDPPAGVATVCGSVRPVEARLYRQVLHRG